MVVPQEIALPTTYALSDATLRQLYSFSSEKDIFSLGEAVFWSARAIAATTEAVAQGRGAPPGPWQREDLFVSLCFSIAYKLEHQFAPMLLVDRLVQFDQSDLFVSECAVLEALGWRPIFRCPFAALGAARSELDLRRDDAFESCRLRALARCASIDCPLDLNTTAHELAAAAACARPAFADDILNDVALVLQLVVVEVALRATSLPSDAAFRAARAADAVDAMSSARDARDVALRRRRRRELWAEQARKEAGERRYRSPATSRPKRTQTIGSIQPIDWTISCETPSPRRTRARR